MATGERSLLDVEKEIIDTEDSINKMLYRMRWARCVVFGVLPLSIAGLIAGNLLIDFSPPGAGEAALNAPLVFSLLASTIGGITFFNITRGYLRIYRKNLLKLHAERDSLAGAGGQAAVGLQAFFRYRGKVPELRNSYWRSASKYRSRHNRFQLVVIVGSILASVSTTAAAEQGFWSWLAVALSASVSVSAGIISQFKYRERSMNLQQTADSIDQEVKAHELGIRRYKGLSPEQAAAEFAEEIERLKEEQRKKELQLEQPPDGRQGQDVHNPSG
ncbi:DUF4231 domain-containing protein [Streptomyces rubiginosohelvolus]|uniref:DUF4231 domain-containing protein n=1 Tax=Streptomyces rubiginosohelvolus TaxID=67362 RepID=A0ABQ3BG29_9ACTN|nr:DUF4231 domain-containing protein [Streptomyces pluricolorescens]GGZ42437.1 hypothetical protein GCM10010328_15420 [Streptomyces pluricolorescens]